MNNQASKYYKPELNIFGEPQIYRGISLYPLKISEGEYLDLFYELFTYPQASVSMQDPRIYKMSYLKFLIYVLQMIFDAEIKEEPLQEKLIRFLKHITKEDKIVFKTPNSQAPIETLIISLEIGDVKLTEMDFANLREIILEQNGSSVEYVEEYNEKLERDLNFVYSKGESLNFQDQVFSFAAQFHKTIDEIKNCTLYQMKALMESMGALQEYNLQVIPLTDVTEKYEFKPYLTHIKKRGRYDSILQDVDEFKAETDYFEKGNSII